MQNANALSDILPDKPVAYHPILAEIFGSVNCALFASQLIYWSTRGKLAGGWIWKTQADIKRETGLSRSEQETARRKLVQSGVLEEKLRGIPATLHYRINVSRLQELVAQYDKETQDVEQDDSIQVCEDDEVVWRGTTNRAAAKSQSNPEITSEITSHITAENTEKNISEITAPAVEPANDNDCQPGGGNISSSFSLAGGSSDEDADNEQRETEEEIPASEEKSIDDVIYEKIRQRIAEARAREDADARARDAADARPTYGDEGEKTYRSPAGGLSPDAGEILKKPIEAKGDKYYNSGVNGQTGRIYALWCESHADGFGSVAVDRLNDLIDTYGGAEVESALVSAMEQNKPTFEHLEKILRIRKSLHGMQPTPKIKRVAQQTAAKGGAGW